MLFSAFTSFTPDKNYKTKNEFVYNHNKTLLVLIKNLSYSNIKEKNHCA